MHHPFVLVIFDPESPIPTTNPFLMHDLGIWYKQNLPAGSVGPHTPVEIFDMKKILCVEWANVGDHSPPRHHAGAGNRFDLDWDRRNDILVQTEIRQLDR